MKRSSSPFDHRCAHCGTQIPRDETARTHITPPNHEPLLGGEGWVVCGPRCPDLHPDNVYYPARNSR